MVLPLIRQWVMPFPGIQMNRKHPWKLQVSIRESRDTRIFEYGEEMKIKNVFDAIFSMDNLYLALEDASAGRRYNQDVLTYSFDSWALLQELRKEVMDGTYHIDRYFIFYVYEPKKRMIMAISFKHRIVQWAIYRVINPILVNGYIEDSYGCIPGRGSLSAMKRLRYWIIQVSRKDEPWFYLKLDISKYFYRVSHRVLKKILAKKIKDTRLLEILYSIIDCEHTPFGLPLGCSPGDVPLEERLFDVGMPIGNLLSQVFANVYLDVLDQFCKRKLRIHYYIRYMDDVIILCDSKMQLREWKDKIEVFLESELELHLNNKTCIRPINQGIEFVGYRIWPDRVIIRKNTSLRIKRSLRGIVKQYKDYKATLQDVSVTLQSYLGMLEHCNSEKLIEKILNELVLTHADTKQEEIYVQSGNYGIAEYDYREPEVCYF